MATVSQVFARPVTGDPTVDAIIGEAIPWNYLGRTVLYYTFSLTAAETTSDYLDTNSVRAFNTAQQTYTREVMNYAARVTGIQFVETGNGAQADVHFANADLFGYATGLAATSWRYGTSGSQVTSLSIDSYVYLDNYDQVYSNLNPAPGSLAYETLLHEIGHVLGLKHPHDGDDHLAPGKAFGQDNTTTTLMSYQKVGGYHTTFSPIDLRALDWLYGGDGLGGTYGLNATAPAPAPQPVATAPAPAPVATAPTPTSTPTGTQYLFGTAANETFRSTRGDDYIDGGAGLDVSVYAGVRANYTITRTHTGAVSVRDNTGVEGTDTLVNIERLKFADVSIALDVNGTAGKAYRLYEAAFDRVPDVPGLGYQMTELDRGVSLAQVAQNFINSPEFARTYGALTNAGFVNQLYQNVLDRDADASGLQYHLGRLSQGVSRNDVLLGFSESPENQAQVIGSIQDGMVYTV